jgi:RNA polymerase sigma-32 factor
MRVTRDRRPSDERHLRVTVDARLHENPNRRAWFADGVPIASQSGMASIAHSRIREGEPRTARAPKPKTSGAVPVDKPRLRSVETWEEPRPADARASAPDRHESHSTMMTYLQQLRRHPLLAREDERRIALEYVKTGDAQLAGRLVTANLRLVVKIALEYRSARRNLLDLVQEGNVGLLHAVQKYDPNRGVKLATYAAWWIRAYILKFILSNARLVKLGTTQAQRRLFFGLRRERARLEGRDGKAVGARQLAAAFSVSEQEVVEMERRMSGCDTSLDWPTRDDDDERTRGASLSAEPAQRPDAQSEARELSDVLGRELRVFQRTLTGRDAEIFNGRLVSEDPTTLAEIAERFGVSRERVRQIEERLKMRLRRHLRASLGDAVPGQTTHEAHDKGTSKSTVAAHA